MTAALGHGLRNGRPIGSLIRLLDEYLDQAQQHDTRRHLLDDVIAAYPDPASSAQQQELAQLHDLAGHTALAQHRLDAARAEYESVLTLLQTLGARRNQGVTYHQLGGVALAQRRFQEAEASYRKALDIYLEFGDRYKAARPYSQLGVVAQEQGRFEEAGASYRKALDVYLEFDDQDGAALTYDSLGIVAQDQRRYADAEASYRRALEIHRESDRQAASSTASQLGIVLGQLGHHREAVETLLYAAATWRQETGEWDRRDLQWLHRERGLVEPGEFAALVEATVPPDLRDELIAAVDEAGDPEEAGEPGAGQPEGTDGA